MRERDGIELHYKAMAISFVSYGALLVPVQTYRPAMPEEILRTVVLSSPMLGSLLLLWAITRHFRRIDASMQMMRLESLAICAALTATPPVCRAPSRSPNYWNYPSKHSLQPNLELT